MFSVSFLEIVSPGIGEWNKMGKHTLMLISLTLSGITDGTDETFTSHFY